MSFVLISKMAKLKINHIRHTFSTMQRSTTVMPVLSQFLNNRLIGDEFSSDAIDHTRLKREDYKLTIHDTVFSRWQPLIGLNDWKDFNNGKEGVRKYRHEDLPPKHCAGLYELGVALISDQNLDQKFDPDKVVATYLGQSVDVRSRLQDYGRSGGHLPLVLFEDAFSQQGSILFRYALMRSKWEAAATEEMLLSRYNYLWNTCSNGERRQLDLLMSKRKSQVLVPSLPDQVVTRIKEETSNSNILASILKQMKPFG